MQKVLVKYLLQRGLQVLAKWKKVIFCFFFYLCSVLPHIFKHLSVRHVYVEEVTRTAQVSEAFSWEFINRETVCKNKQKESTSTRVCRGWRHIDNTTQGCEGSAWQCSQWWDAGVSHKNEISTTKTEYEQGLLWVSHYELFRDFLNAYRKDRLQCQCNHGQLILQNWLWIQLQTPITT